MRLTIEASRGKITKLIEAGMSRRKAAKVLGVDEGTIRGDLRKNSAKGAEKSRTTKAERRAVREAELASNT